MFKPTHAIIIAKINMHILVPFSFDPEIIYSFISAFVALFSFILNTSLKKFFTDSFDISSPFYPFL